MPTEKLYWQDPFATTFEAVARASSLADKPTLVLDRTLFYPESGGQLADTGALVAGGQTVRVADVQVDDEGVIHHLLELPLALADGAAVSGTVDARRGGATTWRSTPPSTPSLARWSTWRGPRPSRRASARRRAPSTSRARSTRRLWRRPRTS